MRGRKPTPNRLKLINGNPGKRRIDAVPQPQVVMLDAPDALGDEARAVWDAVVPELYGLGLVSVLDAPALTAFCICMAEVAECYADIRANGRVYEIEGRNGMQRKNNPHVAQMHAAMTNMRSFGALFGLSPADRVRLVGMVQGDLFAAGGPGDDGGGDFAEFVR